MNILEALYLPKQIQVGTDNASRQRALANLLRVEEVRHFFAPATMAYVLSGMTPAEDIASWLASSLRSNRLCYVRDPAQRDIWQSPRRTLERGGGDCEDLAIVGLAMLHHQGLESYLVTGVVGGNGHAWIEGRDRKGGFLIEATSGALLRGRQTLLGHDGARPSQYCAEAAIMSTGYLPLAKS